MFMKFLKFTLATLFIAITLMACDSKNDDFEEVFSENTIALQPSQVVPASTSAGTGSAKLTLNRTTGTLTYVVTYSGLTNNAAAVSITGIAVQGANPTAAPITQKLTLTANKSGTFTGTLIFDGTVFKQEDLLNGRLFMQLTTKATSSSPEVAELRGQLVF